MDIPPSYGQVKDHLDQIISEPSTPLEVHAVDKLRTELITETDPKISAALLTQISRVLLVLQEDPTPLTALAIRVSTYLNFAQLQSIDPAIDYLTGIKAPSPPINLLTLFLLKKASEAPSHAAVIAGNSDLVLSLIELWLSTSTTEVAQAAFDVLWSLLEVDHSSSSKDNATSNNKSEMGGQGLMWRRLFQDKNVYGLFFSICSLENVEQSGQLTAREKTVAQGRLMDLIVKIGSLDWEAITTSHFSDIESSFKSNNLLEFVACQMVDTEDVLLHMTLVHFLCELLQIGAPGLRKRGGSPSASYPMFSSPALQFLISAGLHDKILNYYLDRSVLDPAIATYLLGPVMAYVSQYALLYPNHLLKCPQTLSDRLLSRIIESFDIPSAQWAHGPTPSGDLNILASVPRVMLLQAGTRGLNPILSIPSKPLHKDSLDTLGRIFHGPPTAATTTDSEQESTLDGNPTNRRSEAAAARVLYFRYLDENPDLWGNVAVAAEILAMHDTAVAAINLIKNVVTANWAVISPDENVKTGQLGPPIPENFPATGAWALLVPPALTVVLPYLFKHPQTYANFVAGGAGDTESAVWKVATAKYEALVALESAVENIGGDVNGIEDIIRTLKRRVAEGPLGPPNQIGSRVDALEL